MLIHNLRVGDGRIPTDERAKHPKKSAAFRDSALTLLKNCSIFSRRPSGLLSVARRRVATAVERAAAEGFHFLIHLLAQPADLAFGDGGHAHRFDQIVDRTGRERLRRAPSRLAGVAPGRLGSSCLCAA
jgi:hypothetical protein